MCCAVHLVILCAVRTVSGAQCMALPWQRLQRQARSSSRAARLYSHVRLRLHRVSEQACGSYVLSCQRWCVSCSGRLTSVRQASAYTLGEAPLHAPKIVSTQGCAPAGSQKRSAVSEPTWCRLGAAEERGEMAMWPRQAMKGQRPLTTRKKNMML